MWEAHAVVLVTDLGDELVLLQAQSTQMFQLNGSGRVAWLALPGTTQQVEAALVQAFDIAPPQARVDAAALLADLSTKHLIRWVE